MNHKLTNRKAKCRLHIVDAIGNPVSNTKLQLKQTNHEFLFGCGAFDTLPYVNQPKDEDVAFLKDRVNKWLDLYNYGTLPVLLGEIRADGGTTGNREQNEGC